MPSKHLKIELERVRAPLEVREVSRRVKCSRLKQLIGEDTIWSNNSDYIVQMNDPFKANRIIGCGKII